MNADWSIRQHRPEDSGLWNNLVGNSRQGTLLHYRGYMDYHSDRFRDSSLIALHKGEPTAILPANITADRRLISHQGLTYGGWLTPKHHFDGTDMLRLFDAWLEWCRLEGIGEILYKAVPHIYQWLPAEEDIYALFRNGASLEMVNLSSVIDYREFPAFNSQQMRNLKRAYSAARKSDTGDGPWCRETRNAREFMPMLEECLRFRHDAAPVHTAYELQRLIDIFPGSIRLFLSGTADQTEAGVCLYVTNGVAHCQYIATTEEGRRNGTLAFLFEHLINDFSHGYRYFDFGTSNEDSGHVLNSGLLHQKVGLGGRGVAYPTYRLTL